MKFKPLALLLLGTHALCAYAFSDFTVKDIRVEGIQRIEPGTIFNYLPVKVGQTMTGSKASEAIHSLYATGFFTNVDLADDHGVLVVKVHERPAIANISFSGNHTFNKKVLDGLLKDDGLVRARIFDRRQLQRVITDIKEGYFSKGKYGVQVTSTVTYLPRNRVSINLHILEGKVAKIQHINIVGNHDFSTSDLRGVMTLRTPGYTTWFTDDDQYSREKFGADLEALRSFYMDQGYLDFQIVSTQVVMSPQKNGVDLTINLHEGRRYKVTAFNFSGNLLLPIKKLQAALELKPGEVFSRKKLTDSVNKLTNLYGDEGYAYANIQAVPELDKKNGTASFTILIDPGDRIYVRRIDIHGNVRTKDEVIRRELRQLESSWYSQQRIKRSKQRLDRLGFFSNVDINAKPVPGSPDEVDIDVGVTERSTGTIMAGIGYSNQLGVLLNGSISQNNLFGTGNALSVQATTSQIVRDYELSYNNPYFTDNGISRGFDIYKRKYDTIGQSFGDYNSDTTGGDVTFGVPLTETSNATLGLGAESTNIGIDVNSIQPYIDFVHQFGGVNSVTVTDVTATLGWTRDTRDSVLFPTKGHLESLTGQVGLPGADLTYYMLNYKDQYLQPLSTNVSLMLNGQLGYINGYLNKPIPFFKNFYVGGPGSVRGFAYGGIGPQENGFGLGGNKQVLASADLLLPFPGFEHSQALRISAFVDSGDAYGQNEKVNLAKLRVSTGIALDWRSPVGPITFSYAYPIRKFPGDQIQEFQFNIGSSF
ncbi:MAG: outer membrane protein assembly factor BamA [Pseudomonadota bacterium]|nr:outer membrane protein assembly factor BamA [Pseudomonadota bacterium]